MFAWLKNKRADTAKAHDIYGSIVSQARSPEFYLNCGVPDTVAGRFEMVVLHVGLVVERLSAGDRPQKLLGRSVLEIFFDDMDHSMREMGVGDLAVAKKMQKTASAYYGRAQNYSNALQSDDRPELIEALMRNVFAEVDAQDDDAQEDDSLRLSASRLADYCILARDRLSDITIEAEIDGAALFPPFPTPANKMDT